MRIKNKAKLFIHSIKFKSFATFIFLLFVSLTVAQTTNKDGKDISVSPYVDGTLLIPETQEKPILTIIIGGSGPTDRNGNQQFMGNNALKFLAESLYEEGIASFRYDKRLLKLMKNRTFTEEDIRFNDFIKDAQDAVSFFYKANAFSKIVIIGHSQGSLVGMVAAQKNVDGFISIAGAGQEIDDVIVSQIEKQSPGLKENARISFDDLRANGIAANYSPYLASIFRPQLQPFIISWMQYNPQTEIKKLSIPILIINGDKDLQVMVNEAQLLKDAQPNAQLAIIENMNHLLKKVEEGDLENSKTYNEPNLPIMPEVVTIIVQFLKNI